MDKARFLNDPFAGLTEEIPPQWFAEAWAIAEFRLEVTYGLARQVSKCGELGYQEWFLDLLARSLDCDQVAELYREIREQSGRHESEWRDEFVRRFWTCELAIPDPLVFTEINHFLNGEEMSVGWARDAWKDDQAREFLTDWMAEDVGKNGESWCRPDWLEQLDHGLDRRQIIELYLQIRDRSGRPEGQWRPLFEDAFPDCVPYLPAPL